MRVLWLCNIMLPAFARMNHLPESNREGWLTGCFERLIREPARSGSRESLVQLGVCCPVPLQLGDCHMVMPLPIADEMPVNVAGDLADGRMIGSAKDSADDWIIDPAENQESDTLPDSGGQVDFYGFVEDLDHPEVYDRSLEDRFFSIVRDFRPDIVHIFGTEFPHCLAMVRAFHHPEQTLIGIQGLCCSIADTYMADLPYKVQKRVTFRDWFRKDSLEEQRHKFQLRANMEAQALQHTAHITGRTSFDRRVTGLINEDAVYHSMNETLRPEFYTGQWDPGEMQPYRIFLSQGDYPLKGFHYMLQAMPLILEKFPQAQLYVAGNSIIGNVGGLLHEKKKYPEPLWITSYGKYLKSLISRYRLKGHVFMLGKLDAGEMKAQFMKSHVFVCPSIMENSPNSLCEAMLLGMPTVSAKVGGIGDLVADGEEGILFPGGKVDELAEGIKTVFYDAGVASWLGHNARATALVRHNPDTNYRRLLEIYRSIATTAF